MWLGILQLSVFVKIMSLLTGARISFLGKLNSVWTVLLLPLCDQARRTMVSVLQANLISCRVALCFVAFKRATLVSNLSTPNLKMESYRYSGKIRPGEGLIKTLAYPPFSMFCSDRMLIYYIHKSGCLKVMWPADDSSFSRPTSKAREKRPGNEIVTLALLIFFLYGSSKSYFALKISYR